MVRQHIPVPDRIVLFATLALLPPLLQTKMINPVVLGGMVIAPRGFGHCRMSPGRAWPRFDARIIMAIGMGLTAYSLWLMTRYSLLMDAWPVIIAGVFQGRNRRGECLPFTVAFVTLPARLP